MSRWPCLLLMAVSATAAASGSGSFYGRWRIDRLVGYSDISVGEADLHKLVGSRLLIARDRIQVGQRECTPGGIKVESRDTRRLLQEDYGATPRDAGVPETAVVLSAEPCGHFFRVGEGTIVVYQDGGFYQAHRIKP